LFYLADFSPTVIHSKLTHDCAILAVVLFINKRRCSLMCSLLTMDYSNLAVVWQSRLFPDSDMQQVNSWLCYFSSWFFFFKYNKEDIDLKLAIVLI